MTDIYLIEATFEYAEQVWQFRQEVFDDDNNSESQFAGCLSLDEAADDPSFSCLYTFSLT